MHWMLLDCLLHRAFCPCYMQPALQKYIAVSVMYSVFLGLHSSSETCSACLTVFMLLSCFLHNVAVMQVERAWCVVQQHSLISKLCLLTLHFPRLRIIWSRSLHATADIFRALKVNQDDPDPVTAAAVGELAQHCNCFAPLCAVLALFLLRCASSSQGLFVA